MWNPIAKLKERFSAATQLTPLAPPKVKPNQQSIAPYAPQAKPTAAILVKRDRQVATTDLTTFRLGATTQDTIRNLAAVSPDLSAALAANNRMALTKQYTIKAFNAADASFNADATRLAMALAARFDMIPDYATGFSQINSLLATREALAREIQIEGAACMELVLDKSRLPYKFVPLSASQILFYEDDKGLRPVQRIAGQYIDLDVPTFFWVSLDQDLTKAYAASPMESAVQPVLADAEFTNDMRRVLKRAALPRLSIVINREELEKSIPSDVKADPEKLLKFCNDVQADVARVVNGLAPEDALVLYSFVEVKYVDGGKNDVPNVFQAVTDIMNGKVSTGAKTMPSVIGHGAGNQNVASSETLLAMKGADGMVRMKVDELFSKAFTLALRLFGQDVYVRFESAEIELRPSSELEAFKSMRQSRILEQLSFGMLSDEEACLDLTGQLPPAGYVPVSGTRFSEGIARGGGENPYSGTGAGGGQSGGGAANQSRAPKTPTQAKS